MTVRDDVEKSREREAELSYSLSFSMHILHVLALIILLCCRLGQFLSEFVRRRLILLSRSVGE